MGQIPTFIVARFGMLTSMPHFLSLCRSTNAISVSDRYFAKKLADKPVMNQEEIDRMFGLVDPLLEEPEQGQGGV